MAHRLGFVQPHSLSRTIAYAVMVIFLLAVVWRLAKKTFPGVAFVDYPLCGDADKAYVFEKGVTLISVPLQPDCWSGNVMLPAGVKFVVQTLAPDGYHEYRFLHGKRILVKENAAQYLGDDIFESSFRLRGKGEAEIFIQPRS